MVANRVKVNVKLAFDADRKKAIESLSKTFGVFSVTQTFPKENDAELSRLYILEVGADLADSIIKVISSYGYVEFAEKAAPRKLIQPIKKKNGRNGPPK